MNRSSFRNQQPSEIKEIKVSFTRTSDLDSVSYKKQQPLEDNYNPFGQATESSEFTLRTETSKHGPKTRAAMIPVSQSLKPINNHQMKSVSQVFSLAGESTTTSNKGLSAEKPDRMFKFRSGVDFDIAPLDLSDSSSQCDEEFLSDDDEMPEKPHSEEMIQSTLQGQNQYYKYIKDANEIRETFINRKQVRYLGIVIEKDDEYNLKTKDTQRIYLPTKDKYMEIVKGARVLHLDEIERNKNLCEVPKTMKRLKKKVRQIINQHK